MRGIWLGVVIGLLSVAGVILLYVGWLIVTELWRDYHPKQPKRPEPPRSIPTSQELVLDNLRTLYFEDSIDSAEFEARVWEALTGTAIEAEPGQKDEVFRLRREARVIALEESATPNRVIVENNIVVSDANLAKLQEQQQRVQYKVETLQRLFR